MRIRPLQSRADFESCVALQEATWGPDFADRVPASILLIARETGGVVSGAFDGDRLVAFVFGLTGWQGGEPVHWSDMLAVAPDYRNRGLGRRLKMHQRDLLLEAGVPRMVWTFDPLEARNAHLNLRRLGAIAREYRRDMYGVSDSPLHAGIGTDRLLAEWQLDAPRVTARLTGEEPHHGEGLELNPPDLSRPDPRPTAVVEPRGELVRIAVPARVQRLKAHELELAVAWRHNVREAFERAFAAGYVAVDLERDAGVSRYVLTRSLVR